MNFNLRAYLSICLTILLSAVSLFAQNQNNQWRFGNSGAFTFNTTPPTGVSGSQITTGEGSASVADRNTGALLFYTNGVTVWNALDQVMPNGTGLLGGLPVDLSSTTAAVIVPRPGNPSQYYILTIDEQGSNNGLRYSVVDMTLNGGLGDVVSGQKNLFIFNTTSEKLEVVPHANGQEYWAITHDNPGNSFYAFRVNATGVNTTPVVSTLGGAQGNGAGHMKMNRQWNKLAMGELFSGNIELFDFNNNTGQFSNPVIWDLPIAMATSPLIYGVEFSPDGSLLYCSNLSLIYQFSILSGNAALIQSSAFEVFNGGFSSQPASLQLGPDQKIYVNSGGSIDVIECPNIQGAGCGFQSQAISNPQGGGGYGLPKWVYYIDDSPSENPIEIIATDFCVGSPTSFSLSNTAGVVAVNWNFGDPSSGANNVANDFDVTHVYASEGNYSIQAILTTSCGFDTVVLNPVNIINCNQGGITGIKFIGDTCDVNTNFSFQVLGTSSSPSFFWDFGDPASGTNDTITITGSSPNPFPTHTFSAPGEYTVCVTFQEPGAQPATVCTTLTVGLCCSGILSLDGNCLEAPVEFTLQTGAAINSVLWNFGDPQSGALNASTALNPEHLFSQAGNYTVTVNIDADCGTFSLDTLVSVIDCETSLCEGVIEIQDSCLDVASAFNVVSDSAIVSVSWNFGDPNSGANNVSNAVNPIHVFSEAGDYNITAIVNFSCGIDTINTTFSVLDCNPDDALCTLYMPNAFSPNGDVLNESIGPKAECNFEQYSYSVYNRWGNLIFQSSQPQELWDGKYLGSECPEGVYIYLLMYKPVNLPFQSLNGTIVLLR